MSKSSLEPPHVQTFLASLGIEVSTVALIGAGAWSQCFAFRHDAQDLVIRFGNYVDDFQVDKLAHRYKGEHLPIPRVLEIGEAFGGYYAISKRIFGVPLESVNANEWRSVVPSLVNVLEAMRLADLSHAAGFGGWGANLNAPYKSWREHLLAVGDDTPQRRTFGWREKLKTFPKGEAAFKQGYEHLQAVASDAVSRFLVHADLINRNVFVDDGKISGVFDWGCSLYGDHLYDLAWFEFWAPWHPNLDVKYLRTELEKRWSEVGYIPESKDSRLLACYLHIGLDHLAYNAHLGDWETLQATARQMERLAAR